MERWDRSYSADRRRAKEAPGLLILVVTLAFYVAVLWTAIGWFSP